MTQTDDIKWIMQGEDGMVADLLQACMHTQETVLEKLSGEKSQYYGFACELIITGEGGGIFDLWFCDKGIQPKPPDVPIRNYLQSDIKTLKALVTPDWRKLIYRRADGTLCYGLEALACWVEAGTIPKLEPMLYVRRAFANGDIIFSGEKPEIDSERLVTIFNNVIYDLAFPIVVKGITEESRRRNC